MRTDRFHAYLLSPGAVSLLRAIRDGVSMTAKRFGRVLNYTVLGLVILAALAVVGPTMDHGEEVRYAERYRQTNAV